MSLLARQSLKFSIISYFSFVVGTLANIILYPLDWTFAGKLQSVVAYAELIYPFVLLGLSASLVKFYPLLKERNQQKSYFNFSFLMVTLCTILVILGYVVFQKQFETSQFAESAYFIFAIVLFYAFNELFTKQSANLERIAIPSVFNGLFPRLGIITAFCLYFFAKVSPLVCLTVLSGAYLLSFLGNAFYVNRLDAIKPSFSFPFLEDKVFRKELFQYSLFAFLVNVGYAWSYRIDKALINEYIDSQSVALYGTFLAMLTAINIPTNGVYAISSPLISKYLNNNDISALRKMYQENSLRLFILGSLLFCMIGAGAVPLFSIMKNSEKLLESQSILYILGFSTLFDIATGFNSVVISFSKYYKINLLMLLVLMVLTIVCNLLFLRVFDMGITGVAWATFISMFVFNIVKSIFIYKKFKIQPFTKEYIAVSLMIITSLLAVYYLPNFKFMILNFYKSGVVLLIFMAINAVMPVVSVKEILKPLFKKK